jgi:hypothetical protein
MKRFPIILAALALLISPALGGDPLSPFGVGSCYINNRSAADNSRWIPQIEAIGLHSCRTPHTDWTSLEPKPGEWTWETLDQQMDYLAQHGMNFGGTLIGNPRWNTKDKPGSLPVNNIESWSGYVSAVVRHAKGRIKRWEVWNEPPNFTGKDQTPADYAKILASAYDAAKAADPSCLVGLAAKSAHINYLEHVIRAGGKDHFDFITLHPYEVLNGVADDAGTESVFLHIVPTLRKMLAKQDPARANVPVIFTELGCDVKKGADVQANALVKAYTMGIAEGVECIDWFEGRDGDSGPMGLLDAAGKPRPCYEAMKHLIEHLGQNPKYLGWVLLNDRHYAFAFQGARTTALITWAHTHEANEVSFGRPVQMVDVTTGESTSANHLTLTTAPTLILDVPEATLKQAQENKGKPFPWDGDFSKAQNVSLTMGEEPHGEQGLHTLSGESLAKAVVVYGGSARAGNVPGGNVFMVDPEFLSYTTTPIEIEVVVRRNEANDNAGFKLVYESTTGFKTAGGWYTVPDNKQWHTQRWRIEDPQFVNYWGYNFSLVSDGNVYNKYYMQSVTVRKLAK